MLDLLRPLSVLGDLLYFVRIKLGVTVTISLLNACFAMFWRRNKKKQIDCGQPQKAKDNLAKRRERDLRRFSITAVRSPVSIALELATARTIRSRETVTLSVGVLRTITTLLEQIDSHHYSSNLAGLLCLISSLRGGHKSGLVVQSKLIESI